MREVEPEERLVLDWEDDGQVVLELEEVDGGTRLHVVETSPEWSTALELHALAWARGRLDGVFEALGDPGRRALVEAVAARGDATATELAAELPVTPAGGLEAARGARRRRPPALDPLGPGERATR